MRPVRIESYSDYLEIVDSFSMKGSVSNDYLQREAEHLVSNEQLYCICGSKNAFLLVKKEGFWRVYYYINDFEETIDLGDGIFVTEILYRGTLGEPVEEVSYLQKCGFHKHILRDQYSAKYSDLSIGNNNSSAIVGEASSLDEVKWAVNLFNSVFDKWSGDFISPSRINELLESGAILIAKDETGRLLGAFESDVDKNVNWLRHFAIEESARGKGIGKLLFDAVIEKGHVDDKSRYMLWVQHLNKSAVSLYQKKGFKYTGKSSLSMVNG